MRQTGGIVNAPPWSKMRYSRNRANSEKRVAETALKRLI
jgi:hypothetical protein